MKNNDIGSNVGGSTEYQKFISVFKGQEESGTSNANANANTNGEKEEERRRKILQKRQKDDQTSSLVFQKMYQRAQANLQRCFQDKDRDIHIAHSKIDNPNNSNGDANTRIGEKNDNPHLPLFGVLHDLEQLSLSQISTGSGSSNKINATVSDDMHSTKTKAVTHGYYNENDNSKNNYRNMRNIDKYYSNCNELNSIYSQLSSESLSQRKARRRRPCDTNRNKETEEEGYAVIISFTPSIIESNISKFRTFFINLLYLLTYKHAHTVIVLYRGRTIDDLKADSQYGKRIWEWHLNDVHPVRILTEKDIEKDKRLDDYNINNDTSATTPANELFHHVLFPFHPILLQYFDQEIVLFFDHNDNNNYDDTQSSTSSNTNQLLIQENGKIGGEESYIIGYELSKLNSLTLVGREEFIVDHYDSAPNSQSMNSADSNSSKTKDSSRDSNQPSGTFFIPQCHTDGNNKTNIVRPIMDKNTTTRSSADKKGGKNKNDTSSIMSSSGIFITRSHFCFIWHPIFELFRTFVQKRYVQVGDGGGGVDSTTTKANKSSTSLITTHQHLHLIQSMAVSTLITQLSGQMPLSYPLIQQTWKANENEDENTSDLFEKGRRLSAELDENKRSFQESHHHIHRRRKNWDLNFSPFDSFDVSNKIKESEGINNISVHRSQHRRRLQQQKIAITTQSQQYLHYHRHNDRFSTSTRLHLSNEDYEFIHICRGYFGSYSSQTNCWCDEVRAGGIASDHRNWSNDCSSKCKLTNSQIPLSMIESVTSRDKKRSNRVKPCE